MLASFGHTDALLFKSGSCDACVRVFTLTLGPVCRFIASVLPSNHLFGHSGP